MEGRQRDYGIYIRDFVMDPAYVKYLYENGLKKEAERVEKLAFREKKKLREKKLEEKIERVIAEIFCDHLCKVQESPTIHSNISLSSSNAIQFTQVSLSPMEVEEEVEEETISTSEREQKIIKEIEEELQKNTVGDIVKDWKFAKGKKKNAFKNQRGMKTCRIFLNNPLVYYAGLDLRTNPFEEWENDESTSSLSMWKEFYKEKYSAPTF